MRPQDVYPELGASVAALTATRESLEQLAAQAAGWSTFDVRVDGSAGWEVGETLDAVRSDLRAATELIALAIGRAEGAWSATGRLSAD